MLSAVFALFAVSVVFGHLHTGDDWSWFNHRDFPIIRVLTGETLIIQTGARTETVRLLGIVAPNGEAGTVSRTLLDSITAGRVATLLLQTPQSRDDRGQLLASVFVDGANVSVVLARAGAVYAGRKQPGIMSGLIDPAEAEARKKKRGIWQNQPLGKAKPNRR